MLWVRSPAYEGLVIAICDCKERNMRTHPYYQKTDPRFVDRFFGIRSFSSLYTNQAHASEEKESKKEKSARKHCYSIGYCIRRMHITIECNAE